MDRTQFQDMMDNDFATIKGLNSTKGADYSGNDDALLNFKRAAANIGLTPEQVWSVYATKHWDAIMTFVREGDVKSEPVEGRIHDVILYCFLLLGLIREKQELDAYPAVEVPPPLQISHQVVVDPDNPFSIGPARP